MILSPLSRAQLLATVLLLASQPTGVDDGEGTGMGKRKKVAMAKDEGSKSNRVKKKDSYYAFQNNKICGSTFPFT